VKTLNRFDSYRAEFPITENFTFLNHAAVSPISLRVEKTMASLFEEFSHCGLACYEKWAKRIDEVRELFATLIHGSSDEIAFLGNTSEGLSAIASGIKWKAGDGVMVPRQDFPANIYPWMNLIKRDVRVHFYERREGRFVVESIKKSLRPGTRLLSVSSVDFATGFLCDLEALGDFCRRNELLFCVDAIQSLGIIPMDVKKYGVHFLASGAHKWLLSPMGCGGLFISKDINHIVHPEKVGWKSVIDDEDFFKIHFELKPNALRFETGTMNVPGIHALGSALELLMEVGIEEIFRRVLLLNDHLYRSLGDLNLKVVSPWGWGERSGILSFIPNSAPDALFRHLKAHQISVSLRGNMIRLSPHFYNNAEDINRFLEVLDSYSR